MKELNKSEVSNVSGAGLGMLAGSIIGGTIGCLVKMGADTQLIETKANPKQAGKLIGKGLGAILDLDAFTFVRSTTAGVKIGKEFVREVLDLFK